MAQDYDLLINDLGFNVSTSEDKPYERATAQFRKEQFDSQATVGDQSLTGWWTRGQLSFHKGAGVTYYEILEGETVLDRFSHSEGVDPFTPGQVTIGQAFDELTLPASPVDCVWVGNYLEGDRLVVLSSAGDVYQVTTGSPLSSQTSTAITTATAGDVVAIAASRFSAYFAIGKEIEVWSPGGTSTVLWTGGSGVGNIVGMWFAKQRLWLVDDLGLWYSLSTAGGTFTSSDAEFSIKDYKWLVSAPAIWSLVDSPGPVYIGVFNEVYAVSVDFDSGTLLPTISAPVLVTELPGDETIYCLGYTLGTLVIALGMGARFAQPDGGVLSYGPRVTNVNFSEASRIAAIGTRVAMPGFFFDAVGLWSFDLGQMVDTLTPAHALETKVAGAPMVGSLNTPQGLIMWSLDTGKLYRRGSVTSESGFFVTGFHRYGTLDPKFYSSVLVRKAPGAGTIDVYRVDPDPTVSPTLLGSVDETQTNAEFDLGPDDPVESVALKFVLNVDDTDPSKAPTFLGYQLKALPMPKRQRMIRVPLQLLDSETNRYGQVMLANAKTRLQALEALESSNALVTFEDKIYGETGTAYIEALEYTQSASRDFGGTLWVTLRKTSA